MVQAIQKANQDKKIKKYLSIFWITLLLLLTLKMILDLNVGYETNDDMFLSLIPSGFLKDYYPYTIHNNIFMGYLLAGLSRLLPIINWATAYNVICIVISYIALFIWCIYEKGAITGSLLSLLTLLTTYISLVHRVNYTKTGGFVIAVGLLLFSGALEDKYTDSPDSVTKSKSGLSKAFYFIGAALVIIGCLFRYKSAIAVIPFFLIYVIAIFVKSDRDIKSLFPFLGLLAIILILWAGDYILYHTDDEWAYFKKFNDTREQLLDLGAPGYEGNEAFFDSIGLSENDVYMLKTWQFADKNVFNVETFDKILEYRSQTKKAIPDLPRLIKIAKKSVKMTFRYTEIYFIILLFFISLRIKNNLPGFLLSTAATGLFGCELIYLVYLDRYPERALYLPIVMGLTMNLFFFDIEMSRRKLRGILLVGTILLSVAITEFHDYNRFPPNTTPMKADSYEVLSDFKSNPNNLYIWDVDAIQAVLMQAYNPLEGYEYGLFANSTISGGWFIPAPIYNEKSEPFGDKYNLFKLLAENDHVYLVTWEQGNLKDPTPVETFIREHYNPDATCTLVDTIKDFHIYSFVK